jgi:glycosyltransferase involved in cell wall biosynthesis
VLNVHEPYVPLTGWRWTLMGAWQRVQLGGLLLAADSACASTEAVAQRLSSRWLRTRLLHVPVGSNLPDMATARSSQRARLGHGDETLVVAVFGTRHPSRLLGYAVAAIHRIAEAGPETAVLNLGAGAPALPGLADSIPVLSPGFLEREDLARHLATVDLFLAPWTDGVSTRRGTLMAALQHGLPVLGTAGPLTGPALRDSGALELTPVGRPDLFARAAQRLAVDRPARLALGRAGRALYASTFDWPVIAGRILEACRPRT